MPSHTPSPSTGRAGLTIGRVPTDGSRPRAGRASLIRTTRTRMDGCPRRWTRHGHCGRGRGTGYLRCEGRRRGRDGRRRPPPVGTDRTPRRARCAGRAGTPQAAPSPGLRSEGRAAREGSGRTHARRLASGCSRAGSRPAAWHRHCRGTRPPGASSWRRTRARRRRSPRVRPRCSKRRPARMPGSPGKTRRSQYSLEVFDPGRIAWERRQPLRG